MPWIRIAAIVLLALELARLIYLLAIGAPLGRALAAPDYFAPVDLAPLVVLLWTGIERRPGWVAGAGLWLLLVAMGCMILSWACAPNWMPYYPHLEPRNLVGFAAFIAGFLSMIGGAALAMLSLLFKLVRRVRAPRG